MNTKNYAWFIAFLILAQVFGLGMITMVIMWMHVYQEGFTWYNLHVFNFHPGKICFTL